MKWLTGKGGHTDDIKTHLYVMQPGVFSDCFLVVHLQIWHNISNIVVVCRCTELQIHHQIKNES